MLGGGVPGRGKSECPAERRVGGESEKASVAHTLRERCGKRTQLHRWPLTSMRGVKRKKDFRVWILFCVRWEAVGALPESFF